MNVLERYRSLNHENREEVHLHVVGATAAWALLVGDLAISFVTAEAGPVFVAPPLVVVAMVKTCDAQAVLERTPVLDNRGDV